MAREEARLEGGDVQGEGGEARDTRRKEYVGEIWK